MCEIAVLYVIFGRALLFMVDNEVVDALLSANNITLRDMEGCQAVDDVGLTGLAFDNEMLPHPASFVHHF